MVVVVAAVVEDTDDDMASRCSVPEGDVLVVPEHFEPVGQAGVVFVHVLDDVVEHCGAADDNNDSHAESSKQVVVEDEGS